MLGVDYQHEERGASEPGTDPGVHGRQRGRSPRAKCRVGSRGERDNEAEIKILFPVANQAKIGDRPFGNKGNRRPHHLNPRTRGQMGGSRIAVRDDG